jgi:hypothetical protein
MGYLNHFKNSQCPDIYIKNTPGPILPLSMRLGIRAYMSAGIICQTAYEKP